MITEWLTSSIWGQGFGAEDTGAQDALGGLYRHASRLHCQPKSPANLPHPAAEAGSLPGVTGSGVSRGTEVAGVTRS